MADSQSPAARDLFDLSGQVAVVTGAGRGLGRALAHALGSAGAAVALFDIEEDSAGAAAKDLAESGISTLACAVDVSDTAAVERGFAAVVEWSGLPTILINNAGVTGNSPFEDLTDEEWERVMSVNLGGPMRASRTFGSALIEAGLQGSLINVASISGLVGNRGGNNSHYCASKGGLIALTKSLAVEWAPHGIRVNAVAPGYFETAMTDSVKARDAGFYAELIGRVPLGRFGRPPDLAGTVVFLASRASAYVTGHTLVIDGGYTAW